jgi:F-type H+-transporting ATPase subunit epsilon
MSEKITVSIVTPHGTIFNGDVHSVTLPGKEGEFGVLAGHAGTLSLLSAGVIEVVKDGGDTESLLINWGYAKVDSTKVDILADSIVSLNISEGNEIARVISRYDELLESIKDSNVLLASVRSKVENILDKQR